MISHYTPPQRDPETNRQLFRKLLAEARRLHRPHQPVDWRDYSGLKTKLSAIYAPGSPEFDDALRQLLDALETGE